MDPVRLVAQIAPVVASATPPAWNLLSAFGLLARLYSDPRYRPSAAGRIGPTAAIAIAIGNYLFWNYLLPLPVVGTVAERLVLIGLAMIVYAILVRELDRYRKVLDYLAKYG